MNSVNRFAIRDFDELPDAAYVRLPVVATLYSISSATVWRWCRSKRLPEPTRIGRVTLWRVGDLRAHRKRWPPGT